MASGTLRKNCSCLQMIPKIHFWKSGGKMCDFDFSGRRLGDVTVALRVVSPLQQLITSNEFRLFCGGCSKGNQGSADDN